MAIAGGWVKTYPYGFAYTAGYPLAAEGEVIIGHTDHPVQINFAFRSYKLPATAVFHYHGLHTTPFLKTGDYDHHLTPTEVYNVVGEFDMRGKAVSCTFSAANPTCPVFANYADNQLFEIINDFDGRRGSGTVVSGRADR